MKLSFLLFATAMATKNQPPSSLRHGHRGVQEQIVGGETAGAYPAFAKLTSDTSSFCGSTLVHEDILLSAAHCGSPKGMDAFLGSNKIDGSDADEVIQITDVRFHPQYNSQTNWKDVMLLKLASPSKATPVKMNTARAIPADAESVKVVGFGLTTDGGASSNTLLEVDVNVVSFSECNRAFNIIDPDMICAAAPGKDACQNDSGGPLFNKDGTIVGIVSFGGKCADPNAPGVYARVSGSMDFIRQGICEMSANPPADCPSRAPTPTPPTPTPPNNGFGSGAFCFSGLNAVVVQGKGDVMMQDLQAGDKVQTPEGYSAVYSFLHINRNEETSFVKFSFANDSSNSLEITPMHFVSTSDGKMVRAQDVKVGDSLMGETNTNMLVSAIDIVKRHGFYAPATHTGTLIVGGVVASNYVSLLDVSAIPQHDIAHAYMAPLRWWCGADDKCEETAFSFTEAHSFLTYVFPLVAAAQTLALFPFWVQLVVTTALSPFVLMIRLIDGLMALNSLFGLMMMIVVGGMVLVKALNSHHALANNGLMKKVN